MNLEKENYNSSSIALTPSFVTVPAGSKIVTVLEFLCKKFPHISISTWKVRIENRSVFSSDNRRISLNTFINPPERIYYYREVKSEKTIPFLEKIIYSDENIIIVDKPHFLPVTPGGNYVNETLTARLRKKFNNKEISPANRIDRETAGLVLFTNKKLLRSSYQNLFAYDKVTKIYKAIAVKISTNPNYGDVIRSCIVPDPNNTFRRISGAGRFNSETRILSKNKINNYLYEFILSPKTGKKHQLRVHLADMGFKILNDRFYPVLREKSTDDYNNPLKLLSEELQFTDPLTGKEFKFKSSFKLF